MKVFDKCDVNMMLDKNGIRLMVSNFVCPLCSVNFIPLFELKINPGCNGSGP